MQSYNLPPYPNSLEGSGMRGLEALLEPLKLVLLYLLGSWDLLGYFVACMTVSAQFIERTLPDNAESEIRALNGL